MTKADILIAVNTVWVAQSGGTQGSPAGPLLNAASRSNSLLGCARAKPGSAQGHVQLRNAGVPQ